MQEHRGCSCFKVLNKDIFLKSNFLKSNLMELLRKKFARIIYSFENQKISDILSDAPIQNITAEKYLDFLR